MRWSKDRKQELELPLEEKIEKNTGAAIRRKIVSILSKFMDSNYAPLSKVSLKRHAAEGG